MAESDSLKEYLQAEAYKGDLENFRKYAGRKTGFSNWDRITSLYPGLYVLGAITSLGKTSFCLQLAEQLATAGETVLYFSLEQTRLEMATKCLSRNLYLQGEYQASAINIRKGILDNGKQITTELDETIKTYTDKIGDRLNIIECAFDTTIEDICGYITDTEAATGKKPIVFIDYLQILNTEQQLTDKQKVDYIVKKLKQTQKENDLVFFVISSLNRQNYLAPVDYEAFKESGGIDYTADVILGLQLQVLHDEIFSKENKLKEKREKIKEAKRENPRKVELVGLKNRYGIANYSCGFNYYPGYDLFIPEDDFQPIPPGSEDDLPFN